MISGKWKPYSGLRFKKKFASTTRFALFINKTLLNNKNHGEHKVDYFHEIPFFILIFLTLIFFVIFIINVSNSFIISEYLGKQFAYIFTTVFIVSYCLYYVVIECLCAFIDRSDYKNMEELDKEKVDVIFSKNGVKNNNPNKQNSKNKNSR